MLTHVSADWAALDTAVRCATGELELLDAVVARDDNSAMFASVEIAARWARRRDPAVS